MFDRHLLLKNFLIWTAVCWVAAAPSFWLGALVGDKRYAALLGMAAGVFAYVFAYTWLSSTSAMQRFKRRPFVLRTLKIGYGIRIMQSVLSIVPPIVFFDMVFGSLALAATSVVTGIAWTFDSPSPPIDSPLTLFIFHFIATIIEGAMLNVVLFILMLLIWSFQRLFLNVPRDPAKFCTGCGYDLRASRDTCPECGQTIPAATIVPPPNAV